VNVAVACEVLARRIVHQAPKERLTSIMSTRFKHVRFDGDESNMSSALEMAIDSHWYYYYFIVNHDLTLFQYDIPVVE